MFSQSWVFGSVPFKIPDGMVLNSQVCCSSLSMQNVPCLTSTVLQPNVVRGELFTNSDNVFLFSHFVHGGNTEVLLDLQILH